MVSSAELGLWIGLLVDGIGNGLVLAMLGLSITLVFGLGGVLNLSIGVFAIIGMLVAYELQSMVPHVAIAIAIAALLTGVVGLVVDRSLLPLVYRSEGEERMLVGIFATLGLAFFLQGFLTLRYPDPYSVHVDFPLWTFFGGDILVRGASVATILTAVVVLGLLYGFFEWTYLGQATRTVMQDEIGASLCGIDTRTLRTYVFILSVMVASIAGILYSFTQETQVATAFGLTINAIIVSVVGGVTSIAGAVVAGLAIGILSTYASAFVGAYFSSIIVFVIAIVVLLVRPGDIA